MNEALYTKRFTGFCKAVRDTLPNGEPLYCLREITENVKQYSLAKFKKEMCFACQQRITER